MRFSRIVTRLFGISLGMAATALLLSPSAHAQTIKVVMSGLDNPRGLAFGPDGALYVAEAGRGGNGPSVLSGDGSTVSYGATGAVSRLLNGTQSRVVTGLASLADQTSAQPGSGATGLHDIVFQNGTAYGIIGFGTDPALRSTLGAPGSSFGQLVRLSVDGSNAPPVSVADVSAYETTNNPDGAEFNSNPYGLVAALGGGFAVADAGGNSLLRVTQAGVVSTIATFPNKPNPLFPNVGGPTYQAVPTAVAQASDGSFYVSQLTGFPFIQGAANIFHVSTSGVVTTIPNTSLTNLIDLTIAPDGALFALQLTTNGLASQTGPGNGLLVRIDPITGATQTVYSGLFFPGGVAIGPDGAFYVTNLSTSVSTPGVPGTGGQVIRIEAPEPGVGSLLALGLLAVGGIVRRTRK